MIVADSGANLAVCTQTDHALLAAKLLALWRRDGLPGHPRRAELLFAIREHDNGWQRADAVPRMAPDAGVPASFDSVPASERLDIWRRGVRRHVAEHPYASWLIARHARHVNRAYFEFPGWPDFRTELEALDERFGEETGVAKRTVARDHAWLQLADTLSLGACGAFGGTEALAGRQMGYRYVLEPGRIRLSPFPLAGVTTLEFAFRSLPKRRFRDTAELTAELVAAAWRRQPVTIEPLEADPGPSARPPRPAASPGRRCGPSPSDPGAP